MITTRRLFLFEAEDDDNQAADNTAENNDTSADNNTEDNDTTEENNEDNNQEEDKPEEENNEDENKEEDKDQNDENQDEDNNEDDTTEDDFSIGGDDEEKSDDDSGSSDSEEAAPSNNELKAKERELFDTLSIPEQQIKIKELRRNFSELYGSCNTLIDRFNEISVEYDDDITYINRLVSLLIDLKGMISFYILNLYDIKSYFENDIMFNRYLTIFDSVRNTMADIKTISLRNEVPEEKK